MSEWARSLWERVSVQHGTPVQAVVAAITEARDAERAAIVAWLRDQTFDKQDREWMGVLDIADAIERGDHLKENT